MKQLLRQALTRGPRLAAADRWPRPFGVPLNDEFDCHGCDSDGVRQEVFVPDISQRFRFPNGRLARIHAGSRS
jgi:hypothetical protein